MQTVPSLVGTGTAVAAAASGLVFGQPLPTSNTAAAIGPVQDNPSRALRRSHQRTISVDRALDANRRPPSIGYRRPLTTSAAPSVVDDYSHNRTVSHSQATSRPPLSRHQRPQSSQFTSPRAFSTRLPLARPGGELSPTAPHGGPRDSVSSNSSWIRRLSIRPLSQSSSPRSSLIADSTSTSYSPTTVAPVPLRPSPTAPPLLPNKLVKRAPFSQVAVADADADVSPRWRPRHLPTLRRPATSHQRSATLQQLRADVDVAGSAANLKYSLEQPIGPEVLLGASPFNEQVTSFTQSEPSWGSFFHLKAVRLSSTGSAQVRPGDASFSGRDLALRRIHPQSGNPENVVHLVQPKMISAISSTVGTSLAPPAVIFEACDKPYDGPFGAAAMSVHPVSSTRTRRSLSESFSSATNWVAKRSGSLRRPKENLEWSDSATRRHVSDPTDADAFRPLMEQECKNTSSSEPSTATAAPTKPLQEPALADSAVTVRRQPLVHHRNQLSPPPGHSLVHSVGTLPRPVGLSRGGATARYARPNQPSGSSTSSTALSQFARGSHYERSSAMESSDCDGRGFTSGDDDELDFKSDTMFDSVRTLSSCRARAIETPLESVYDESPPSTAGNGRSKRLSVQEMLARGWDEENKIMEEDDESTCTPVRSAPRVETKPPPSHHDPIIVEPNSSSESPRGDMARLTENLEYSSVDGLDNDEDWTRDDEEEAFSSPLSAPSSSLGSKGMNPNVRLALASIEGETLPRAGEPLRHERPLSNLFGWSETSMLDKHDDGGISTRPKTAYAMPEMDSRGGRSAMRRGPTPTHVRSQSVPVVHDSITLAKPPGPKYGTWGMGAKTVSEDWDEDFEFGLSGNDGNGEAAGKSQDNAFAVPEAIRATQPSVRAHSGQIRELSLLVNDLKRLCRHGRELNMLKNDQTGLWREAEGIIALASPDEEDEKDDPHVAISAESSSRNVKANLDGRYDTATPDQFDAAFDSPEPAMRKTAVVRERQSPRRRSVFSPEDDVFGGNWPSVEHNGAQGSRVKQPRTPDNRPNPPNDVSGAVRSVMEYMRQCHRASTEPPREPRAPEGSNGRVQFDTNSLKALVKRAGELRDVLSDAIRKADQIMQSPASTPRRERRLESSPAFTRVFDDPSSSPLRYTTQARGTKSMMESTSTPDKPPSSPMSPQMPLMTVG